MILFLCIFCIVLYLVYYKRDTPKYRSRYVFIITTVLILVSGLRHQYVGSDTINFLNSFDEAVRMSWSQVFDNFIEKLVNPSSEVGKDPALFVYDKIIGLLFFNGHVIYLGISAALLLIPLGMFLKKHANSMATLLFAYLFFISIYYVYLPNSALRQGIALGLLLLGYMSLDERNSVLRFFIFLGLAVIFHKSALLGVLMLLPKFMKIGRTFYIAGIPLFVLMLFEYEIVGVALSSQSEIYSMYSGSFYSGGKERPFVILLFYAGLYLLGLFQLGKYSIVNKNNSMVNYALTGTVFTLVFTPLILLDPSLIRITAYFIIWMMIYVPDAVKLYDKSFTRLIFVACAFMFLYKAWKSGGDYAFFWQEMQRMIE